MTTPPDDTALPGGHEPHGRHARLDEPELETMHAPAEHAPPEHASDEHSPHADGERAGSTAVATGDFVASDTDSADTAADTAAGRPAWVRPLVIALVILAVIALVVALVTANSSDDDEAGQSVPATGVTFKLEGEVSEVASVHHDGPGGPVDLANTRLPWSATESFPEKGRMVTLSAVKNAEPGALTCTIFVDGRQVNTMTMSSPGATVTCAAPS